jgi:hypothetical protein
MPSQLPVLSLSTTDVTELALPPTFPGYAAFATIKAAMQRILRGTADRIIVRGSGTF